MKVVVVGAGVVGVSTAYFLHRGGAQVVVVERREGAGLETSYANGALLHPSMVEPWNSPGILGTLLRSLGREDAAVLIRGRALPTMLAWGIRFLRESAPSRFERNARKNLHLARESLACMAEIRATTGIDYHAYWRGVLMVYRDTEAFAAAQRWNAGLVEQGVRISALNRSAIVDVEPRLSAVASALVGGFHAVDDEGGDAHAFSNRLSHWLAERGVVFRYGAAAAAVRRQGRRVAGVSLADGEVLDGDAVVLCAGAWTAELASRAGVNVPIRPAKGYSLTLPRGHTDTAPFTPTVDATLHAAVVPVAGDRIRVAGTAEFAGFDASLRPSRAENLAQLLECMYPEYADTVRGMDRGAWCNFRPLCPDGVPIVGATRIEGLFVNSGHGHIGWTTGAGSGRLAADTVLGRSTVLDARDYAPGRF